MKLGKRELDCLVCPPERRDLLVFDDELTGFGVRVTAGGARIFLFQYRQGRDVRRVRLGLYGELTPAEARREAARLRTRVLAGGDPAAERKASAAEAVAARAAQRRQAKADRLTLAVLLERWAASALKDRSPSHRREAPRAILRAFATFAELPAYVIEPAAAQRVLDGLEKTKPTMAARVRAYGRAAYGWGVRRGLVPANPFAAVTLDHREVSRDRVLTDDELGAAWRGAGELGAPFASFIRLLILTLQRRSEVAGMRWSELTPDLATWTLPATRAKNGKAHIVHLSAPARAELGAMPRVAGSDLVFTTNGRTPIAGFSRAAARLRAPVVANAAEPPKKPGKNPLHLVASNGWRLHDFRRTGVTVLARLGVAPHVADRLLNHVQGSIRGVAAVYQRHDFLGERAAALDLWAAHVSSVASANLKK